MIKGMREAHGRQIVECRGRVGAFTSVEQFHRATGLPAGAVRRLAEADAFGSLPRRRRQAAWDALALEDGEAPLFDWARREKSEGCLPAEAGRPAEAGSGGVELEAPLPPMPLGQEVMSDYATVGLSLKQHPVGLVRAHLGRRGVIAAAEAVQRAGGWVKVAGLVLIRQRPGTASGVVFVTLEDETGVVNLILRPEVYDRYRAAARGAMLLQADGYVERQGQVVHVLACRLHDLSELLEGCDVRSRDFH